nr:atherin-like [Aegilops tauschii subsp. strangulata]
MTQGSRPDVPPVPQVSGEMVLGASPVARTPARRRAAKATSVLRPQEIGASSSSAPEAEATSAVPREWTSGGGTGVLDKASQEVRSRLQALGEALQNYTHTFLASRAAVRINPSPAPPTPPDEIAVAGRVRRTRRLVQSRAATSAPPPPRPIPSRHLASSLLPPRRGPRSPSGARSSPSVAVLRPRRPSLRSPPTPRPSPERRRALRPWPTPPPSAAPPPVALPPPTAAASSAATSRHDPRSRRPSPRHLVAPPSAAASPAASAAPPCLPVVAGVVSAPPELAGVLLRPDP